MNSVNEPDFKQLFCENDLFEILEIIKKWWKYMNFNEESIENIKLFMKKILK